MPRTGFRPDTHGFHFSNNDIRWSFGAAGGRNLCGGMTFASLDHYYHRMSIPPDREPPAEGTPLHSYILQRQMQAHRFAMPRLVTGNPGWRGDRWEACMRADQYFGVVKRSIDAGRPVPVLLASADGALSTNSHWVLATGYESSSTSVWGTGSLLRLYLYDNNQPDREATLEPDMVGRNFRIGRYARQYSHYAPFEAYQAVRPTPEAMRGTPRATELVTNPFNVRW